MVVVDLPGKGAFEKRLGSTGVAYRYLRAVFRRGYNWLHLCAILRRSMPGASQGKHRECCRTEGRKQEMNQRDNRPDKTTAKFLTVSKLKIRVKLRDGP